jgi:hypothetical protein
MPDPKQTPGKEAPKKTGILKYLDNTIGDDGLRTDVKITVTNETLLKIIAGAVAATLVCSVTHFMIKSFFRKPQLVTIYDPKIHG